MFSKSDLHSGNKKYSFVFEELFSPIPFMLYRVFFFKSTKLSIEYIWTGCSLNSDYVQPTG